MMTVCEAEALQRAYRVVVRVLLFELSDDSEGGDMAADVTVSGQRGSDAHCGYWLHRGLRRHGDGFESSPTNAFADDAAFASNIDGRDDRHRYYNYAVSLGSCNVVGIEARLDWWMDSASQTNSMSVELSWDGGTSWTAAKTDATETTVEHTVVLGGAADNWGRAWTAAEVSDTNFRLRITSNCSGATNPCNARDYFLDWVAVKVHYAP